jgi:hypothetical protein
MAACQIIFEWTKHVIEEARSRLYGGCNQHLEVQLVEALSRVRGSERTGIIVQHWKIFL